MNWLTLGNGAFWVRAIFLSAFVIMLIVWAIRSGAKRGVSRPSWISTNAVWLTCGWGFLILIAGLVIGEWWWGKVFSVMGIALIAGFTLYGYMTEDGKPFRYKLAMIGIWILVGVAAWHLFGKEYWPKAVTAVAGFSGTTAGTTTADTTSLVDYNVIAPVGKWSERIPTLHGEILRYHGPVLRRDDKGNVVERDDVAVNPNMAPVLQTAWVQVQSRTTEPVVVTVSR